MSATSKDAVKARIAELIIQAQIASDSAKGKRTFPETNSDLYSRRHAENRHSRFDDENEPETGRDRASRRGYAHKDWAIINAIRLIALSHNKTYRYSVSRGLDQNDQPCFIVYFDFKIEGKRQQISFHCFNESLSRFVKNSSKSSWNKKNCAYTARQLDKKGASPR